MNNLRTHTLAVEFYRASRKLKLPAVMRDQFDRATLSIPLNLAKGSAKASAKERRKFYRIALGSLREVQSLLQLIDNPILFAKADCLGAHLYKLCKQT